MASNAQGDPQSSFGFEPLESVHHFVVTIPRSNSAEVVISEHLSWDSTQGSSEITYGNRLDGQVRVVLARPKWDAIADEVRTHFNQRSRRIGRKAGVWRSGANLVRRDFGKELVLLAWAIEEADPSLIANALINWFGLEPEERWWLYTQTAAMTGHALEDRSRGWRKAVRFALTEHPIQGRTANETTMPEWYRQISTSASPQPTEEF